MGVEGSTYTFADARSYVAITSDDGHYCVSGNVGSVVNDEWAGRYGAVVAYQLNQQGNNTLAYDARAHGVTGFTFRLAGNKVPTTMQVQYTVDGEGVTYCKPLSGPGIQRALFSEVHPDCVAGTNTSVPDSTRITQIEILIPPMVGADLSYDFCVEDMVAVR